MENSKNTPFPSKKDEIPPSLEEMLQDLFEMVPPEQLRKSIHIIFSRYLQTINNDSDLEEFKLIAEDFYFFISFWKGWRNAILPHS